MNYRIEQFDAEKHLAIMNSWAAAHGDIPFHMDQLPPTTFVAYENDEPQMAISIILTNTKVAWIENLVGNPNNQRSKMLNFALYEHMLTVCRDNGKRLLFCISRNPATSLYFQKYGFIKTLSGVETFFKEID